MSHGIAAGCFYALSFYNEPDIPTHYILQLGNILILACLLSLLASLHAHLAHLANKEKEQDEREEKFTSKLFDSTGEKGRHTQSLKQFCTLWLPMLVLGTSIIEGALASWVLWIERSHIHHLLPKDRESMLLIASLAVVAGSLFFFLAKYVSGIAFGEKHTFLRPISGITFFSSVCCFLGCGVSLFLYWGYTNIPIYCTWIACCCAFAFAGEKIVILVINLYRPSATEIVYESRILMVFFHPQNLWGSITDILEYQLGVNTSKTSMMGFAGSVILPCLFIQLCSLVFFSGFVYIRPYEIGLIERTDTGTLTEVPPGLHLWYPWPFCRVYRLPIKRTRTFSIPKTSPSGESEKRDISLWDTSMEKYLFLSSDPQYQRESGEKKTLFSAPVRLLAAQSTIQYSINDPIAFFRFHRDVFPYLEKLAERVVIHYFADHHLNEFQDIGSIEEVLQGEIQRVATSQRLGVNITHVQINMLQPPPSIAQVYRRVLEALEEEKTKRMEAETYALQVTAQGEQEANRILRMAEAETAMIILLAEVESKNYHEKYEIFSAFPKLYTVRETMDVLEKWLHNARKIIMLTDNAKEVITLDLKRSPLDLFSPDEE